MKAKEKPVIQKIQQKNPKEKEVSIIKPVKTVNRNINKESTGYVKEEQLIALVDSFIANGYNKTKALNETGLNNLKGNKNKSIFSEERFVKLFAQRAVFNKLMSKDLLMEMAFNEIDSLNDDVDVPPTMKYKLKMDLMTLLLKIIDSKTLDKSAIEAVEQITFKIKS